MLISDEIIEKYPNTSFGLMSAYHLDSGPDQQAWEKLRDEEINAFRSSLPDFDRKKAALTQPLAGYMQYYKRFKKTYPVLLQMESVLLKQKDLHSASLAVEVMFLAEVKNGLLVAGHDLAELSGDYALKVAKGDEELMVVSGQCRKLKEGDIFMADGRRILSSVLEGQDFQSRLTENSSEAIYCVYGMEGVGPEQFEKFFQDLKRYIQVAFPSAHFNEVSIFRAGKA